MQIRGIHADVWDKTSNFIHFEGASCSDMKRYMDFHFYPTFNFLDGP